MIKYFLRITFFLSLFILLLLSYLSLFGLETNKFNNQIRTNIKKIDTKFDVKLNKVKLVLDPFKLNINAKTLGPTILYGNKILELETIRTDIPLKSLFNNKISSSNISISSKSIKIKELISFSRTIKNKPELFLLDRIINSGYIVADIDLKFDKSGKILNNFKLKGFIKDASVNLLDQNKIENINFMFNSQDKLTDIKNLNFDFKNIGFKSDKISIKDSDKITKIKGILKNDLIDLSNKKNIDLINSLLNTDIEKINFSSNNQFFLEITKKFKIKSLNIDSTLDIKELSIKNLLEVKNFFPEKKEFLDLKDHKVNIKFSKNNLEISGEGKLLMQKEFDQIKYNIKKSDKKYTFKSFFNLKNNLIDLQFLNFKKEKNSEASLEVSGVYKDNKGLEFDHIILTNEDNNFEIKNLFLNENLKIINIDFAKLNFVDLEKQKNYVELKKISNNYEIISKYFNANKLIDDLFLSDSSDKLNIFNQNVSIKVKFDKVLIGDDEFINDLAGYFNLKNNEIVEAKLSSSFSSSEKLNLSIISNSGNKVTTFYSPNAKPFVKRYKFIKGFDEGSLDFYSVKTGESTTSKLKIYDFKLKELPALTKILTLASLQGIADLLSGEGIRFNEFEMSSESKKSLTTINEIYAIGPAISILMDGYVEKSKLVSLRGTLVPATTINKAIGSIPILGDILVGKKTGEGVFGVSFKIKGPPKNLETTVNPIKTLTPRFITRTLEKIKKN